MNVWLHRNWYSRCSGLISSTPEKRMPGCLRQLGHKHSALGGLGGNLALDPRPVVRSLAVARQHALEPSSA
eukprot:1637203-Alexandrium_andersonii.AAC.1